MSFLGRVCFLGLVALIIFLAEVNLVDGQACTVDPGQLTRPPGSVTIFTCRCSGIIQRYTWSRRDGRQFDVGRHAEYVDASGAGLLVLYTVQPSDSGTIICQGRTDLGVGEDTSNLVVPDPTGAPTTSVEPRAISRIQGGTAVLVCSSAPSSQDNNLKYAWSRPDQSLPPQRNIVLDGGKRLFLYSLLPKDGGTYICTVTSSSGTSSSGEAELTVNPTSSPNPVRTVRPTRPPVTIPPTVRIPQPLPSSINFRVNVVPSSTIRRPGGASFMVCNAQLPPGYVTSSIEWGKNDGSPLPFGRTKRYTCNTVLYMHDLTSRDAGFYSCRVEATNSVGQRISSQGISNVRVVDWQVTVTPAFHTRTRGQSAQFTCSVSDVGAQVQYQWTRSGEKGIPNLASSLGARLTLTGLREEDTGEYCCSATVGGETSQSCAELLVGDGCIKNGEFMPKGTYRYFNTSEIVRAVQVRPAADIIILVDESRSMIREHAWLQDISLGLDAALRENGIGLDIPNQFGLVGFAKDDPEHIRGRVFPMSSCDGSLMGSAEEFNVVRENLALDGREEDLYHAMSLALDTYPLRPGQACQIIGITDEGRTPQLPYISYNAILAKMREKGCMLNVVVNQKMVSYHSDPPVPALGVSAANDSAVEIPGGDYRIYPRKGYPIVQTAHGSTHLDYTLLAFELGGAAWDLNKLRDGGDTALSFTKAFIRLKVREISRQLCERCFCDLAARPDCRDGCVSEAPVVAITGPKTVNYGEPITLVCISVAGDPIPELAWQGPDNFPGKGLPPNALSTTRSDFIELQVPNTRADFCVDCNGTNFESSHTEQHCVTVTQEQPKVSISGSNNQRPVIYGSSVTLECTATAGIPTPALTWLNQPAGSVVRTEGTSIFLTIESFTGDVCVRCVGTSEVGEGTAEECIRVQQVDPEVMISGSHNGAQSVIIGTPVELRCIVLRGIPTPQLAWGTVRPASATVSIENNVIVMNIPALLERTCIDCIGTSAIGQGMDQECIDVTSVRPTVSISGSNNGRPIIIGGSVTLTCEARGGIPPPRIQWASNLPPNALSNTRGDTIVLTLSNVLERTCITCVGSSLAGDGTDEECVEVEGIAPIVRISGSNSRRPIVIGTGVTLECVSTNGIPRPQLTFGNNLPPGATSTRQESGSIILTVPDVRERTCFTCVGTNLAGEGNAEECIEITREPPVVRITGSNNGQPVIIGQSVDLRCTPTGGIPLPTVAWGGNLPGGASTSQDGASIVVTLSDIRQRTCVTCVGTSLAGTQTAEECIEVISIAPVVTINGSHRGQPINIGTSLVMECRPIAGIPSPLLSWSSPPIGAVESRRGNVIIVALSSVLRRECFTCLGSSLAGQTSEQTCVDVRSSEPEIRLSGSNNGRPVVYGNSVRLECEPVGGIPFPTVSWGGQLPEGASTSTNGNTLVVTLDNIQKEACVQCIGTSLGGETREDLCVPVLAEPPTVTISGTNKREPVTSGTRVLLNCSATAGIPTPRLAWLVLGGGRLPTTARTRDFGSYITVEFPSFDQDICLQCVGSNAIGTSNDEECLKLDEEIPIVRISGSNNGQAVNPGDGILLECTAERGFPNPEVLFRATDGQDLPSTITRVGDRLLLEVTNIKRDFCVTCEGSNTAGKASDEICVEVVPQVPIISLTGTNKGLPLNEGGLIDLVCVPISGVPLPTVTFRGPNGGQLPPGATVATRGNGSVLSIPGVSSYTCVECVGTNSEGAVTERLCFNVLGTCPHPERDLERVFHGSSNRRFFTEPGEVLVKVPAAAVVAFVIDESGSMRGEHQWLRSTVETLESNLQRRGIGTQRANQYALVGFGHKDDLDRSREGGKVLLGSSGCGTAGDLKSALAAMFVDGRLEDGYSAIGTGLDQIPCLQQPRPQGTACQVILATDEGRDILSSWRFRTILDHLRRYDCVLNVVVWEQMQGRVSESSNWQRALGVSQTAGAVIAQDNDQFVIVPHGEAFRDSGHEDTHDAYVELAAATGGAAWDLDMLRTERYRQSFTNGFIEVKIQEIERQIVGVCEDCVCRNGTNNCRRLSRNFGESSCLNPAPNVNLAVTATPAQRLLEPGQQAEFACDAAASQSATISWSPQTPQTLVQGNRLILTNVTATRDSGPYTCRATDESGYKEARVELTVIEELPEPIIPFELSPPGDVFMSASLPSATVNQQTLTLTCCTGSPRPDEVVSWYSNTLPNLPRRTSIDSQGRLIFNPVLFDHAGEYECVRRSPGGTSSATGTLRVVGGQVRVEGMQIRRC